MAKGFKGPGMGRPPKFFDWKLVDALCGLEAELDYVAEQILIKEGTPVTKTNVDSKIKTITRAIRKEWDLTFVQYRNKKVERHRIRLRQKLWEMVNAGNSTIAIWMSKQFLGYSDKSEVKSETENKITITKDDEKL